MADSIRLDIGPAMSASASGMGEPTASARALVDVVCDEIVELRLARIRVVPRTVLRARYPRIDALLDPGGTAPCQDPAAMAPGTPGETPSVAVFTRREDREGGRNVEGWLGVPRTLFLETGQAVARGEVVDLDLRGNAGFDTTSPIGRAPRDVVLASGAHFAVAFHHVEALRISIS